MVVDQSPAGLTVPLLIAYCPRAPGASALDQGGGNNTSATTLWR